MGKQNTALDLLKANIKRLRLGCEMTQERAAVLSNLSYKYYQSLEAGRIANPTYMSIERLARVFGVEHWKLFHPTVIPEAKIKKVRARRKG